MRDGLFFCSIQEGCLKSHVTKGCYSRLYQRKEVAVYILIEINEEVSTEIRSDELRD